MEPWYKNATPRAEVREGRSFNPDEFAIALEQVAAGKGPEDYRDPIKFFSRTCFTRALTEHMGMVLRRLAGRTENSAPVMSLVTQFGGGKTHTLTALFHLAKHGKQAKNDPAIVQLLSSVGLSEVPTAKVAVFVGNAWDGGEGRETPWIDIARQLAGDAGVAALGPSSKEIPPGTMAIAKLVEVAGGSVLILCDEVLNYINRYRGSEAEKLHAFIQNLTVAMTGTERSAAVISLPRSQVEMTDYDLQWQEKINKVVRRVAKDLIANDEAEISEVVRKRLFEDIGSERVRKTVSKTYADWCFERRNQLPPEWTAVDSATTEAKAREFLRTRFETCYPLHPATLSVFHRKWQALRQFQQTRGALAMLAQWLSFVYKDSYTKARQEPLITLGSAPLEWQSFRAAVLGQLGENRLQAAIDADIAGQNSHARALDADTSGALKDIHRRVATTILFESSGGQTDKSAHLPELRFALGEPGIETTSIDLAASQMEARGFFIRKKGTDGFQFGFKPTLKKVVNDRRASLDEEEILSETKRIVEKEFIRNRSIPVIPFPDDSAAVQETTKLSLVVLSPEQEWTENGALRSKLNEWTKNRNTSPRLYPGALIWCVRKQGRELRNKVETLLAWRKVNREYLDGTLAGEFDRSDSEEINAKLRDAEDAAIDEVWASYRYLVLYDNKSDGGLNVIDLGAGHASSGETLTARVVTTLKTRALLNESPGAGYLERRWPEPFKKLGSWPVSALRQAFINGTLERVLDPDAYLRGRIPEFVMKGDFGFASGQKPEGGYARLWFNELLPSEEISFDSDVYLLLPKTAQQLKDSNGKLKVVTSPGEPVSPEVVGTESVGPLFGQPAQSGAPQGKTRTLRISGEIPTEVWNRLGRTLLPKLKTAGELHLAIDASIEIKSDSNALREEIEQILRDLNLFDKVKLDMK
ncbi:MAG TPA: DUF499 domain-containing protein [Candidatus Binatus sp.]|nr:DUF499 domain-containing protein [Candidatus Binatus sp.]